MAKIVLITGCSTGFGYAAALKFARQGDWVVATMRGIEGKNKPHAESLAKAAAEENLYLRVVELDVCSDASVDAAAATVLGEIGTPEIIINNAGVMYLGIAEAYTAQEYTHQLDVNVVGVHRVSRAFLPAMRSNGEGLFINVTSVAGRLSGPTFAIYCASKWALEAYSLGLRQELASSGIDVVVVEPGPFRTELFGQAPSPKDEDGRTATYPKALTDVMESMGASFTAMLSDETLPNDPELVVDTFIELAAMEPGHRPFRTAVGLDFGVSEYNKAAEEFDASVMVGMGVAEAAKLVRK